MKGSVDQILYHHFNHHPSLLGFRIHRLIINVVLTVVLTHKITTRVKKIRIFIFLFQKFQGYYFENSGLL